MDGNLLADGGQYRNRAAQTQPGSRVKIGVIREGRRLELDVLVGRLEEEAAQRAEAAQLIGLTVRGLTPAETARIRSVRGVMVTSVAADSLAAQAGIAPGNLILEANQQPVSNPQEFAQALGLSPGSVLLRLYDMGRSRYITLRWQ
jgi:S1-C subfamily serine protease